MKRRDFVAASIGASLSPALGDARAAGITADGPKLAAPQHFELRRYRLRFGVMETRFGEYAKGVLLPALGRAGIKTVGVFNVAVGPDMPSVYMLLPHASADSAATLAGRLTADPEYRSAAASYRALPAGDPPYIRRESTLLHAFAAMPGLEPPTPPAPSRIFELRTYESHNESAGLKKIEMFEQAGEIAIFRRTGLTPVFFGRNVVAPTLPSLTYMLAFADAAAREKAWAAFSSDPEWKKLRETPGYTNAEIVSNIHSLLLRPTDYSQV